MKWIGEKINATRKSVARAIEERDRGFISGLVRDQDLAGADVIDLNAGRGGKGLSREEDDMKWLVDIALSATEKPLAIDSEHPKILLSGARAAKGREVWINSVSAEKRSLEEVLAHLAGKPGPVVALCMGETGIPRDLEGRLDAAGQIYEKAREAGLDPGLLYFDPMVMPLATDKAAALNCLEAIRALREACPGGKTVLGLSNISFGLPRRGVLHAAFAGLLMEKGLSAAIVDPTDESFMMAAAAANALLGRDDYCMNYIRRHRQTAGAPKPQLQGDAS